MFALGLLTQHASYTELREIYVDMPFRSNGGADGTRTRDPRRDRPVF